MKFSDIEYTTTFKLKYLSLSLSLCVPLFHSFKPKTPPSQRCQLNEKINKKYFSNKMIINESQSFFFRTTFLKSRLNCSVPGAHPFYFNEIQSTSDVIDGQFVYAVFTTPDNSIAGSAVCKFSIKDINNM